MNDLLHGNRITTEFRSCDLYVFFLRLKFIFYANLFVNVYAFFLAKSLDETVIKYSCDDSTAPSKADVLLFSFSFRHNS